MKVHGWKRALLAMVGTLVLAAPAAHAAPSVAMQIDAAHDGVQADGHPLPPLRRRWAVDLGQATSYPLIAGGKVFVIVRNPTAYGDRIVALDEATGATTWERSIGGTYWWAGAAYDAGKVFTVNGDGVMSAFDATSGASLWSKQLPGQYSFSSDPTAINGVVYTGGAGSGGTLYAVREDTGAVQWTSSVANGDDSSPAVAGNSVFVSYACPNVYAFNKDSGALQWTNHPGCSGGGGATPVFANGRLYVRDNSSGYVFDAASGQTLDSFTSSVAPAVASDLGYRLNGGALEAFDAATGVTRWTYNGAMLSTPPVVVGDTVYAGGGSKIYGLDRHSGAVVWSDDVGAALSPADPGPTPGLGAGDGLLVVPASGKVVAYEEGAPTTTSNTTAPGRAGAPTSGQRTVPLWTGPRAPRRGLLELEATVEDYAPRLAYDERVLARALRRVAHGGDPATLDRALRRYAADLRAMRRQVALTHLQTARGRRGRRALLLALQLQERGVQAMARAMSEARANRMSAAKRSLASGAGLLGRARREARRAKRLLGFSVLAS